MNSCVTNGQASSPRRIYDKLVSDRTPRVARRLDKLRLEPFRPPSVTTFAPRGFGVFYNSCRFWPTSTPLTVKGRRKTSHEVPGTCRNATNRTFPDCNSPSPVDEYRWTAIVGYQLYPVVSESSKIVSNRSEYNRFGNRAL